MTHQNVLLGFDCSDDFVVFGDDDDDEDAL